MAPRHAEGGYVIAEQACALRGCQVDRLMVVGVLAGKRRLRGQRAERDLRIKGVQTWSGVRP